LPAAATDVVDINVLLGDGGALGALRIVASVDVDSSAPAIDFVRINLEQKLWLTEISVVGFSIPGLNNLFANSLRNLKLIPLVPFPVDHTTTNNLLFKNADVRIIDDTSPADQDASAFLLTFGGGSPGDKSAFTQSFVPPGANSTIVASMAWICRMISPLINTALGFDEGTFTDCHLTHSVRFDQEHEVDLTALTITAEDDDSLHLVVSISKSGFCYSATGTVGGKISTTSTKLPGRRPGVHVDNPNIDVASRGTAGSRAQSSAPCSVGFSNRSLPSSAVRFWCPLSCSLPNRLSRVSSTPSPKLSRLRSTTSRTRSLFQRSASS
jgi:hypothetical protein